MLPHLWRTLKVICTSVTLTLAGCAAAPSPYPMPAAGELQNGLATEPRLADLWWAEFRDSGLSHAVSEALRTNPTLDMALARVEEARGSADLSRLRHSPTAEGSGDAQGEKGIAPSSLWRVQKNIGAYATWELDLFGRGSAAASEAGYTLAARTQDVSSARLVLAAETARAYLSWQGCLEEAEDLDAEYSSLLKTARLAETLATAGFAPASEPSLARATAATFQAHAAAQTAECTTQLETLVALTGIPAAVLASGSPSLPIPPVLATESMNLAHLAKRPDVAAAELDLAAAAAAVSGVVTDWRPRITLSGSLAFSQIMSGGAATLPLLVGASIGLPLFDGGQNDAKTHVANARYAQAKARHQQVTRQSLQEIGQTWAKLRGAQAQVGPVRRGLEDYSRAVRLAELQWQAGAISLLEVEQARRVHIAARRAEREVSLNLLHHTIALFTALGGVWPKPYEVFDEIN